MTTSGIIACAVCGDQFKGEGTQAQGCSCHVVATPTGLVVYGHYGSKFDTEAIALTIVPPASRLDPVCDECVEMWIAASKVDLRREYLDFDEGLP